MNGDVTEEELNKQLIELEKLDEELDITSDYSSPSKVSKESIFKFFNRILDAKETTRIANLQGAELGVMKLGVRSYLEIADYADVEGLNKVASYLRAKAEIITRTSMSKKGFWSQLFVTQIKKEQKLREPKEIKKGLFGMKKEVENE